MAETKKKRVFYVEQDKLTSMVQRLQNGESDAAEEIYNAFEGYVERYFHKKVSDEQDVDELVADTLSTACRNINKLKTPVAFVRWLRSIAYRKCYRYYKNREKAIRYYLQNPDNPDGNSPAEIPAKVKSSGLGELNDVLYGIIDSLPEKQRVAMRLHLAGYKVREIAQIQGAPVGTIKSRLRYGRIKIHDRMGDYLEKNGIKL